MEEHTVIVLFIYQSEQRVLTSVKLWVLRKMLFGYALLKIAKFLMRFNILYIKKTRPILKKRWKEFNQVFVTVHLVLYLFEYPVRVRVQMCYFKFVSVKLKEI